MSETLPPKPEDYIIVDGSDPRPRRDFRIKRRPAQRVGTRRAASLTSPKRCGTAQIWNATSGRSRASQRFPGMFTRAEVTLRLAARGRHGRLGP